MMSSDRIILIVQIVGLGDIYGDKVFRQNSSEKKMYGEWKFHIIWIFGRL